MIQANVTSPARTGTEDREIVLTRLLNAPRELVFEAWTNPEHIVHWFGPDGFTTTIKEMSVKPGFVLRKDLVDLIDQHFCLVAMLYIGFKNFYHTEKLRIRNSAL